MQPPRTFEKILSAWKNNGETLRYKEIKEFAVSKGLTSQSNDRTLSRWLRRLVHEGFLEKSDNGYTSKTQPKVYQSFDYVDELKQKYKDHIYEGEVGGIISHTCALTYLSFDESLVQTRQERIAFDALSVRIGELFWALFELRNILLKRRCGLPRLRFPDEVMRETFFQMLVRSVGEHHATEEIVKRYSCHMTPANKQIFNSIWKANRQRPESDYDSMLEHDLFFDNIEANPQFYKKKLLKEEKLDLDKYTAEELAEKYVQVEKNIMKKHEEEMKIRHSFSYSKDEAELESSFRVGALAKLAEGIRAANGTTEDFAVVITRHPATLNEYYTPEHVLHEAIEWAKKPPEDEWDKNIWQEMHEEEKTFDGMVAERLVIFGRSPVSTYSKMRDYPWLKRELSEFGDLKAILQLYAKKRRKQLQEDERKTRKFLDMMSDFAKEKSPP